MAGDIPLMAPVNSSNIEAVGYHPGTSELHVKFRGGSHYAYEGVPIEHYRGICDADSAGAYHAEHVKGAFKHRKL